MGVTVTVTVAVEHAGFGGWWWEWELRGRGCSAMRRVRVLRASNCSLPGAAASVGLGRCRRRDS